MEIYIEFQRYIKPRDHKKSTGKSPLFFIYFYTLKNME